MEYASSILQNLLNLCVVYLFWAGIFLLPAEIRRRNVHGEIFRRAWPARLLSPYLFLTFFLFFFFSAIASFLKHEGIFSHDRALLFSSLSTEVLILTATVIVLHHQHSSWEDAFGLGQQQLPLLWKRAPLAYVAGFPIFLLATLFSRLVLTFWEGGAEPTLQSAVQIAQKGEPLVRVVISILAVFFAPLVEEILFRGVLFPAFARRLGTIGGAAAVSLLFGAIHFNKLSFLPLSLLSLWLCFLYWKYGSLWVPIGVHALFNLASLLIIFFVGQG